MSICPELPGLPRDEAGPVFRAPSRALPFDRGAVALYEKGLFTWPEWAQALAGRVREAPAQPGEDPGDAYYRQWLEALEWLVAAKGASSAAELQRYQQAWDHAADRTPHGQPIELRVGDFS